MASPLKMDSEEVPLEVDPLDLKFPLDPEKKKTSCTLRLSNKTVGIVAFKLRAMKPENYCVIPNYGIVMPRSTCYVTVTTRAPEKAPSDMQCEDKILIKKIVVHEYDIEKHIIKNMFEESSEKVFEQNMRVLFMSPVAESSSCSSHDPCALESHAETSASADAVKEEEKLEVYDNDA